jgi:PglZ domain
MSELGPVSRQLEAELRELARLHGVVVWLDKEGHYTEFVDALGVRAHAGDFPFPVRAFRGSFLEVMLSLDGLEDGIGMTPLVIHVPGHNKAELRTTPMLELYRAGRVHERALATLVREAAHTRATVEQVEAFLAKQEVSLARADHWLAGLLRERAGQTGRDLSGHSAESLFDELQRHGDIAQELIEPAAERALWERLELLLGIAQDFRARCKLPTRSEDASTSVSTRDRAADVTFGLAGWALCVEFVHDLRRPPRDPWLLPLKQLVAPIVQGCQRLAVHIRTHHAATYKQLADQVEELLVEELRDATAEDLGAVDTFRFEDRKVLGAALAALGRGDYRAAHDWSRARSESFWAREDLDRGRGWQLVLLAASLGLAIGENQKLLHGVKSHAEALERYAQRGYRVDAAQRRLEQARQAVVLLDIEEFAELRLRLDALRVAYRAWADQLAVAFNALCAAQGYLPSSSLRQRDLFEDVVRPSTQDGLTAYFTVDALRYELGHQLYEALSVTHTADVTIKARLAELPTVTEVGMNVLAPLAVDGKLRLDADAKEIRGFRSLEARVALPEHRQKVMHERIGGRTCPKLKLEELVEQDVTSLRRSIAGARMVLVHSEGIDKAGEKGTGLLVFEHELQLLRAAWHNLYEAGVRRFVFTADHGFLLHDAATRAPKPHGFKTTPKRRHMISADYLDREGKVAVRAADLDYECDADLYFLFPEDAAPFDIGDKAKDYVHGGNSLQERAIPVITVQHRHDPGAETTRYRLEAMAGEPLARMQCVRGTVHIEKGHALSFSSLSAMELMLECVDDPDVMVELCDARDAKVVGSAVLAEVEKPFELFFRLRGATARRVRVRLKHATGAALVASFEIAERFGVEAVRSEPPPSDKKPRRPSDTWLLELPEGGVRDVFRHLDAHGSINEAEATRMLGGARQYRAFCRDVEELMKVAPFRVLVDVSSGVKCHVRVEG